jgi:hypothetical protein
LGSAVQCHGESAQIGGREPAVIVHVGGDAAGKTIVEQSLQDREIELIDPAVAVHVAVQPHPELSVRGAAREKKGEQQVYARASKQESAPHRLDHQPRMHTRIQQGTPPTEMQLPTVLPGWLAAPRRRGFGRPAMPTHRSRVDSLRAFL